MNHASHAVKAMIYRSDGRILLQHRDILLVAETQPMEMFEPLIHTNLH
jgi:hypothetical protein